MRFTALALILAVPSFSAAQTMPALALDAIRVFALSGTEPIFADSARATTAYSTVAAVAQLTQNTAAIMIAGEVRPGAYEVVARSKPFSLSRETNYGFSVEEFRFTPPDRLELSLSSPNGCARSSTTHRFVLRRGTWIVSGLDRSGMRCTDNGIEQDWIESANYLTGRTVRTTFPPSKPQMTAKLRATRGSFPLSEFPPNGPEAAYAEMQ